MADTKISALTASTTPLAGTEVLPIVQNGVTKQVSVANLTAGRAVATAGGPFTDNITQGTAAKGVNFTANTPAAGMTSQLLNWYEEGTWTPTVVGSTGAGTQTYTWQYGKYTRIGNQVTLNFSVRVASTASMTGNVRIGGLPFAGVAGQINAGGAAINAWGNFVNNSYVFMSGVVPAGASYLDLTAATAATTSTGSVAVNSIAGASFIDGTITYFV